MPWPARRQSCAPSSNGSRTARRRAPPGRPILVRLYAGPSVPSQFRRGASTPLYRASVPRVSLGVWEDCRQLHSGSLMTGRVGKLRPISVNPAAKNIAMVPVNRAAPPTRAAFKVVTSTG